MGNYLLLHYVEKLIQRLKQDPNYKVDETLSAFDLILILWYRFVMMFRSLWWRSRFKECGIPIFIGKMVTTEHAKHIYIGKSVTIDDGVYINALSKHGVILGNNVSIGRFSIIETTGLLTQLGEGLLIGDNSNLGDYNYVGASGGVIIGKNVLIGQRVSFHTANHLFDQIDKPIKEQGSSQKSIVVEDDCWLGSGVIVLAGVTIHRGTVVAAGCVVTKDVPEYAVVGGVPGRVLKFRNDKGNTKGDDNGD